MIHDKNAIAYMIGLGSNLGVKETVLGVEEMKPFIRE